MIMDHLFILYFFCFLEFNGMVSRLVNMTNANLDALRVDSTTWAQQFQSAMNVNGGDLEGATTMDYIMHFLTFGWKVRFIIMYRY